MLDFAVSCEASGGVVAPPTPFTVTYTPTNPMVGEQVLIQIAGTGGQAVTNHELLDIWVQSVFDGAAEDFTHSRVPDRRWAPGRTINHTEYSAGTATFNIETWITGGQTYTQAGSITFDEPENIFTFAHTYWVDISASPSTTGMPANDSFNTRITTWASFAAISRNSGNVRVRFRGGVTHILSPTSSGNRPSLNTGGVLRVDVFGTDAVAVLDITGPTFIDSYTVFNHTSGGARISFYKIRVVGGWNSATGSFGGPKVTFFQDGSFGASPTLASMVLCEAKGCVRFLSRIGTIANPIKGGLYDCLTEDMQDYPWVSLGADDGFVIRGCRHIEPVNTGRGDEKPGGTTIADMGDHALARNNGVWDWAIIQSDGPRHAGWSAFGVDKAPQSFMRSHTEDSAAGARGQCLFNLSGGRYIARHGHHSGSSNQQNVAHMLCVGNDCDFPGPGDAGGFTRSCGGYIMFSNVIHMPNTGFGQINDGFGALLYCLNDSGTLGPGVVEEPNYIWNNTFQSDATSARFNGAGFLQETVVSGSGWVNNTKGNILIGDGHSSGATHAASTVARGDSFRPISGGAAETTIANGPPISIDRVKNTGSTNIGAHDVAGANVAEPDVTISSVTIGQAVDFTTVNGGDYYAATAVAGVDEGGHFAGVEYRWLLDGVEVNEVGGDPTRDHLTPLINVSGLTGSLTLELKLMGRSGNAVTVTSNAISV